MVDITVKFLLIQTNFTNTIQSYYSQQEEIHQSFFHITKQQYVVFLF